MAKFSRNLWNHFFLQLLWRWTITACSVFAHVRKQFWPLTKMILEHCDRFWYKLQNHFERDCWNCIAFDSRSFHCQSSTKKRLSSRCAVRIQWLGQAPFPTCPTVPKPPRWLSAEESDSWGCRNLRRMLWQIPSRRLDMAWQCLTNSLGSIKMMERNNHNTLLIELYVVM